MGTYYPALFCFSVRMDVQELDPLWIYIPHHNKPEFGDSSKSTYSRSHKKRFGQGTP